MLVGLYFIIPIFHACLERAMGNYLKAGDTRSAQDLITLYKERMTPTQKKRFSALFDKYGAAIGW